jgi:hypothetical protein
VRDCGRGLLRQFSPSERLAAPPAAE